MVPTFASQHITGQSQHFVEQSARNCTAVAVCVSPLFAYKDQPVRVNAHDELWRLIDDRHASPLLPSRNTCR